MFIFRYGGSVLEEYYGIEPKDYDYIVECQNVKEYNKVIDTIQSLNPQINSFGGYKVKFKGIHLDIEVIDKPLKEELNRFIELNSDGVFYNIIENNVLTTKDFDLYLISHKVEVINDKSIHPHKNNRREERIKKAIQRLKFMKYIFDTSKIALCDMDKKIMELFK